VPERKIKELTALYKIARIAAGERLVAITAAGRKVAFSCRIATIALGIEELAGLSAPLIGETIE